MTRRSGDASDPIPGRDLMRPRWILPLLLAATSVAGHTADYFLDSQSGSDDNPGTTPAAPLRSLGKLAALSLRPGDTVHFRRGSTFRGRLRFQGNGTEAAPIRLVAYNEGPKPEVLGSITLNDWERHTGDVYKAALPPARGR